MGHSHRETATLLGSLVDAHVKLSLNMFCIVGIVMSNCRPRKNGENCGSKPDQSVQKGSENSDRCYKHVLNFSWHLF